MTTPSEPTRAASASGETASEGRLFAIVLAPGPAWQPGRPFAGQGLRDHFFYWKRLSDAGRVASAGPLGEDHGLVVLRAADQAAADAILAADPAIGAGIFTGAARPYPAPMRNGEALAPDAQ